MNKDEINSMNIAKIREMASAMSAEEKVAVARELPTNVLVQELWHRIDELTAFKNSFEELMNRDFRKKD